MKNIFLIAFFLPLLNIGLQSQSCLPDGIIFSTQAEIDNFPINYPGCTTIEGSVQITGPFGTNITNLDGLNGITAIEGSLLIKENYDLTNLNGLANLTSVGGDLEISYNSSLLTLEGLENINTVGGSLSIIYHQALTSLNGINNLSSVGGGLAVATNTSLTNLSGLENITAILGNVGIYGNDSLLNLDGLDNLATIAENIQVSQNPQLTSLSGLDQLVSIEKEFSIFSNPLLTDLQGLNSLNTVGGLAIIDNAALASLDGLESLTFVGSELVDVNGSSFLIRQNESLTSISALANLTTAVQGLAIESNDQLSSLDGLGSLTIVGNLILNYNFLLTDLMGLNGLTEAYNITLMGNASLISLHGLENLEIVYGGLQIHSVPILENLQGLENLTELGSLFLNSNYALENLGGLENLTYINNSLQIVNNSVLTDLNPLANLQTFYNVEVINNPLLTDCAIYVICDKLLNASDLVSISNNGPGCMDELEVASMCNSVPVLIKLLLDNNGNCQADAGDVPGATVQVQLAGTTQRSLRSTGPEGLVQFAYLDSGPFLLYLPQLPTNNWAACQDTIVLNPGDFPDTIKATFVLSPLNQCPELTVDLGLPSAFRGCLVDSEIEVLTTNTGTVNAENVEVAVLIPSALEVLAFMPSPIAQSGDTLFFAIGDLPPFASAAIQMTVKTSCDDFLFEQTLCLGAFASLENPCSENLPAFSEIQLSAECVDDNIVRFNIKNVGDASTQGPHQYILIRNEDVLNVANFSLSAQESMTIDVPADGATYRMEATKFDDGTLTAIAIENCGGLTPGLITAYWLDEGPLNYDFDCRQVIGSYDPNQKTAVPTGIGPEHLLSANRPIKYTIDFQNTGTDTAFRVLLRDILPSGLDVTTFRPIFASHPYNWEISEGNSLEVLFSPIMLPDSNMNEAASHGFFTFQVEQLPDRPIGTVFENIVSIIFDFNPPIFTNTVWHTIGQLIVKVDELEAWPVSWQVLGNPTNDVAIFRTRDLIGGTKRFELYDTAGRRLRSEQFEGQQFEFQRDRLPAGLYFFKIIDAQKRIFSGRIVVVE